MVPSLLSNSGTAFRRACPNPNSWIFLPCHASRGRLTGPRSHWFSAEGPRNSLCRPCRGMHCRQLGLWEGAFAGSTCRFRRLPRHPTSRGSFTRRKESTSRRCFMRGGILGAVLSTCVSGRPAPSTTDAGGPCARTGARSVGLQGRVLYRRASDDAEGSSHDLPSLPASHRMGRTTGRRRFFTGAVRSAVRHAGRCRHRVRRRQGNRQSGGGHGRRQHPLALPRAPRGRTPGGPAHPRRTRSALDARYRDAPHGHRRSPPQTQGHRQTPCPAPDGTAQRRQPRPGEPVLPPLCAGPSTDVAAG